jgi:hypothetical protein
MTTYVFRGQNASTGTPNEKTGRMSMYGTIYKFENRADAVSFAGESGPCHTLIVVGGKARMRDLCLGLSMQQFEAHLADCVESPYWDEDLGVWYY